MERFLVSSFDTYNQKFLGRSHKGFQQAEGELEQMLSQPMENWKQSTVGKNHLHKIIDAPKLKLLLIDLLKINKKFFSIFIYGMT